MKNFSTVGTRLVFAALLCVPSLAVGAAPRCAFRADAPDQHVVVKGDTLWDIAGRFLPLPWCWPTVWGMNRDAIANPHWIYPGQVIWFDRAAGRLRLGGRDGAGNNDGNGNVGDPPTQRLSPRIRGSAIDSAAVPSIPTGAIEPFLTRALILEGDAPQGTPRVIASQDGHVFLSQGDKAYVRGELGGARLNTPFQVYRPGKALTDPDTNKVIGHEAVYLGTLSLLATAAPGADVHTFVVLSAAEEIGQGDQLRPVVAVPTPHYAPHAPARPVAARVVSIAGGLSHAGRDQVVSINRGKLGGLDIGAVLPLYHAGSTVDDPTAAKSWLGRTQQARLPDEQDGSLFIFRVFEHISYGLIMQGTAPVVVGDVAKSPE